MSKSKHSEAAIIGVLKQVEAGHKVEDVAREQGVSKHTIYAWKAKYGGMEVSEAQEVKQLREENGLKKHGGLSALLTQWVAKKVSGSSGRTRTYNPSVNSRTACRRLALQPQDLQAQHPDYFGIWGGLRGVPRVFHELN